MEIIAKSKYLYFKSAKTSENADWYYVKRTNDKDGTDSAVVLTTIVKKDNEDYFLFLITKRPPICAENKAEFCIESPAGLIADENINESLEDCIKKELLEETGLVLNKYYIELTNSATSGGLSTETITYATVYADYHIISDPIDDGGIIVDRILVKKDDIYSYLQKVDKKKYSLSSVTICGIFWALKRLNNRV